MATLFPYIANAGWLLSRLAVRSESRPALAIGAFQHVVPSNEDWEDFLFDVEFVWDGVSNILISWENRDGSWKSGNGQVIGTVKSSEGVRAHNWFDDRSYPDDASNNWENGLPNIKLSTR